MHWRQRGRSAGRGSAREGAAAGLTSGEARRLQKNIGGHPMPGGWGVQEGWRGGLARRPHGRFHSQSWRLLLAKME